jgi:hypothetical protein
LQTALTRPKIEDDAVARASFRVAVAVAFARETSGAKIVEGVGISHFTRTLPMTYAYEMTLITPTLHIESCGASVVSAAASVSL